MRILLTGASGLIGKNLIKFCPKDVEIVCARRNEVIKEMYDGIIHCGCYAQPIKFLADEIATIKANTSKTIELFHHLNEGGRFLFISSSEVYHGIKAPQSENQIGTTDPSHTRACYIESKRCGEAICWAYKRKGFDAKIVRLSLTYGKTDYTDTRALNHFVNQAILGKKIRLMDDGSAKRTYLYVEDAVKILWDIFLKGTQVVYNVGGRSKITIKELAEIIGKITGTPVYLGDKPLAGAPEEVGMDISRILKEFGDRKFITLEEGLRKMIYG
jgi:UDP-glucuronate decarboxylase